MEIYAIIAATASLIGMTLTIYDKWASSHRKKHRVPEQVLFLLAVLGGCGVIYLTMLCIRHKTNHKRFMLGLPLLFILHGFVLIRFFL